jgi:Transketolase
MGVRSSRLSPDSKGIAGRDASGKVLNVLAQNIPWLLGGSADLGTSNKTTLTFEGAGDLEPGTPGGRNLHFGIREHAMAAVVNGLSLSKLRAFGATFFIFSDYARPAIRLSALMQLPTIFVFTHDAMGDGEDGPTHQPVEQLASFRAMPGLVMLRPGDANEVVEAYRYVLKLRHEPARWRCRVNRCRRWTAANMRLRPALPAAPMCSATPPAATRK